MNVNASRDSSPALKGGESSLVLLMARLPELRGKTLACWCGCWKPGEPEIQCHAVVLAKLVNALEEEG